MTATRGKFGFVVPLRPFAHAGSAALPRNGSARPCPGGTDTAGLCRVSRPCFSLPPSFFCAAARGVSTLI